jgi:hypothetical protein
LQVFLFLYTFAAMEEIYYVITNCDGDTCVSTYTKEKLLEAINNNEIGCGYGFLSEMPKHRDTNYWGGKALIIKGSVVVPKPIKVVEEYDI